jgi:hypothetical protein
LGLTLFLLLRANYQEIKDAEDENHRQQHSGQTSSAGLLQNNDERDGIGGYHHIQSVQLVTGFWVCASGHL